MALAVHYFDHIKKKYDDNGSNRFNDDVDIDYEGGNDNNDYDDDKNDNGADKHNE